MWLVYLCALEYNMCVSETAICVSTSQFLSIHLHVCMPSVYLLTYVYVCHEYVCAPFIETSNPTYFFHCLNERVKRLVVITVINFFSPFHQWKVPWPHPPFPALLDVVCSVRRSPCLCSNGCYTTFFYSTIGPFVRFTSPGCIGVLECFCVQNNFSVCKMQ